MQLIFEIILLHNLQS